MVKKAVQYRLEIMAPGKSTGEPFTSITSDTPFMRFGMGELIDPGHFSDEESREFFKVLHQLHSFESSEDGEIVQKITVFTSKVYDCASLRGEWVRRRA